MSYRFMRIMVMFDLPVQTSEDRRNYRKFRKMLIKNGFLMLQESVYCKMVLNQSNESSVRAFLRENRPAKGNVLVLSITERQFGAMEFIAGEYKTDIIDSDERLIIL